MNVRELMFHERGATKTKTQERKGKIEDRGRQKQ